MTPATTPPHRKKRIFIEQIITDGRAARLVELNRRGMRAETAARALGLRKSMAMRVFEYLNVEKIKDGTTHQTRDETQHFFTNKEGDNPPLFLYTDYHTTHAYGEDARLLRRIYALAYKYDRHRLGLPKCIIHNSFIDLQRIIDDLTEKGYPFQVIEVETTTRAILR